MLTLFGYAVPATLALLGLMGLLSGYIPLLTKRPIPGGQIRVVGLGLTVPLALAIWIGQREHASEAPLRELGDAQATQAEELRSAQRLVGALRASLDADVTEPKELTASIERAREALDESAKPATEELTRVTGYLRDYELFFDRLFVSLVILLLAVALIPATKPFPREEPQRGLQPPNEPE